MKEYKIRATLNNGASFATRIYANQGVDLDGTNENFVAVRVYGLVGKAAYPISFYKPLAVEIIEEQGGEK
jgi:hypothetical protein